MVGYKYRSWKDPYHKDLLINRELYFNSANDFNDLFDSNIELNHEDVPEEEYLEHLKSVLLKKESEAFYDSLFEERVKSAFSNKKNHLSEHSKHITEEIKKVMGIYCLSLENNSIHNWAYYGHGNKGYCLGIDYDNIFEKHALNHVVVQYIKEYPNIRPNLQPDPIDILRIVSLKSIEFEKEKEIRLFKFKGVGHVIKFDPEDVKEIILGNKIDPQHEKEIYDIWKAVYPHASLSRIKIKPKTFELIVVPYS